MCAGYAYENSVLVMLTRSGVLVMLMRTVCWLCLREVCTGYAYEKCVLVMLTRSGVLVMLTESLC